MRKGSTSSRSSSPTLSFKRPRPAFPKQQLFVLACCRICEPIAFMSIFSYVFFLVKDFHITEDENKISFYAGMVTSAFTLAEFSTGVFWGRLSDKVGRKPILLTGLAGTGLSVIIFGFARSLPVALFARALGGILNGNIGVLQTTVAELVTVKEHQPRAYTIMPLVWCLGSILGPMVGGTLARPVLNWPSVFQPESIWDRYPYLLPNIFSAAFVFFGVAVGFLFLEETHELQKQRRDRGLELGRKLAAFFGFYMDRAVNDERKPLLDTEESLPIYCADSAMESQVAPPTSTSLNLRAVVAQDSEANELPSPTPKTFTLPVLLNIVSYGILALHTMTFDQLFPIFLSTVPSPDNGSMSLPFKFTGGFGLGTQSIGLILGAQGVYSMFSTFYLFPAVAHRLGALKLFKVLALSYFLLYLVTPYMALLPGAARMPVILLLVVWKCSFSTMAYPSNAILLTNSAPSLLSLGTINGVAASTASLARAVGPTISGGLYALGMSEGYIGLSWWCTALVALCGGLVSLRLPEPKGRFEDHVDDEESALAPGEASGE